MGDAMQTEMAAGTYNYERENLRKAWFGINQAIEYFRALGFTVSDPLDPDVNGHDLEITKSNGRTFKVEVKAVGFSKRAWRIRDRHLRCGDDFIAFVFPSGRVYVEDFKTHEKLRCKDGGRHLSMIAQLYA